MFLKNRMKKSTESYFEKIEKLKQEMDTADAILIGAGAGLSTAAGFYPFDSLEEYQAWWSRQIYVNRYEGSVGKPYKDLLELVEDKDYFVLTTNVDHQFQLAGFDKKKLFYTQGDYGLLQCAEGCH